MTHLETETAFFEKHRHQWIKDGHEGKWAVALGEQLIGFFPTLDAGYSAGISQFGEGATFLVKQVAPEDPVATIQRVSWSNNGAWPI